MTAACSVLAENLQPRSGIEIDASYLSVLIRHDLRLQCWPSRQASNGR